MYPRRPLHQTMKRKLAKQSEYATSIHSPPFFKGGGGTYSLNLNLKTYCFTYCGGSYVPVGIFLLYFYLSSSLSQSQIIFVLFVACVASVSVWFGAKKDRGRGSVFGFDRVKNETKTKNWKRGQGEGLDLHKCSLTKTVSFLLRTLFLSQLEDSTDNPFFQPCCNLSLNYSGTPLLRSAEVPKKLFVIAGS